MIPKRCKKKKDDHLTETMSQIKNAIENDPIKDVFSYLRDEAEKARAHEIQMMQIIAQAVPSQHTASTYTASPPMSYAVNNSSNHAFQYNNNVVPYPSGEQHEGGLGYNYQSSYSFPCHWTNRQDKIQ